MGIIKRLYLCDKKRPCAATGCQNGECNHTTDRKHAKTGGFTIEEKDGELVIPDNVEAIYHNDGSLFLVEHEEGEA